MAINFNPSNASKVNSLIQNNPQLNVTDNSQANYESNFKKADADGDGKITRDEYKRFAKDALPAGTDLSMFAGADVPLEAFDQALDDWFDTIDGGGKVTATAAVAEKTSSLPPLDPGKTWTNLGAEKIARGEELNFGHKPVDGELWKMQDGSPVWADKGTQVTRDQLAAMPDYQVKKFYQMMGLGYDPKVDFPDPAEREVMANRVRIPDPGSNSAAHLALQNLSADLDALHSRVSDRHSALTAQLADADPVQGKQIQAQLAQLGGLKDHLASMRSELKGYKIPANLSSEAQGRVTNSLKQIHDSVKTLAGVSASDRGSVMASFAYEMNQLRQPDRDLKQDALAQNQYTALNNMSSVIGVASDRMDQLARQRQDADAATAAQIDAQMAQLQNLFQGVMKVATPLFAYRSDPALSGTEREQKAALVNQIDSLIKQMAGADATQFQKLVDQATTQVNSL